MNTIALIAMLSAVVAAAATVWITLETRLARIAASSSRLIVSAPDKVFNWSYRFEGEALRPIRQFTSADVSLGLRNPGNAACYNIQITWLWRPSQLVDLLGSIEVDASTLSLDGLLNIRCNKDSSVFITFDDTSHGERYEIYDGRCEIQQTHAAISPSDTTTSIPFPELYFRFLELYWPLTRHLKGAPRAPALTLILEYQTSSRSVRSVFSVGIDRLEYSSTPEDPFTSTEIRCTVFTEEVTGALARKLRRGQQDHRPLPSWRSRPQPTLLSGEQVFYPSKRSVNKDN